MQKFQESSAPPLAGSNKAEQNSNLFGPKGSEWSDQARALIDAHYRRGRYSTWQGKAFHSSWCKRQILAEETWPRVQLQSYFHFLQTILLASNAFWHQFCSRSMVKNHKQICGGAPRCRSHCWWLYYCWVRRHHWRGVQEPWTKWMIILHKMQRMEPETEQTESQACADKHIIYGTPAHPWGTQSRPWEDWSNRWHALTRRRHSTWAFPRNGELSFQIHATSERNDRTAA